MPELPDFDAVADVIRSFVKTELAPYGVRLAAAETEITRARDVLDVIRERLVGVESKSHTAIDLTPLYERVAVLETRTPLPGPPGPAGKDGVDGKDGAPGLQYAGRWGVDTTTGRKGDVVSHSGSGWVCITDTTTAAPGTSDAWRLFVKRGNDGKDAK
jgi:hypothetical protein